MLNKWDLLFIILFTTLIIPNLEIKKFEAVNVYRKPTINVGSCY